MNKHGTKKASTDKSEQAIDLGLLSATAEIQDFIVELASVPRLSVNVLSIRNTFKITLLTVEFHQQIFVRGGRCTPLLHCVVINLVRDKFITVL